LAATVWTNNHFDQGKEQAMDLQDFFADASLPVAAAALGVAVFLLVRGPMKRLFGANTQLGHARAFFLRVLLILLILGAIYPVIGVGIGGHGTFMECVWEIADELQGSVLAVSLYLAGFVLMITILVATIGRDRDQ
jgi:hypothetical protein